MATLARVKKTGIYHIVYSEGGKRKWVSTHTKDKKIAVALLLRKPLIEKSAEEKTLSSCIKDYLSYTKLHHAAKTHRLYEDVLERLSLEKGDQPISVISSRDMEFYIMKRGESLRAASINIELRAFRTFFNTLKRWEAITKNPCDGIKPVRTAESTPAYLSTEQLKGLILSIRDPWLKEIVIFASMTGLRLGELLNLKWEEVDVERKTILIQSSVVYNVKFGKIRTIPLNETAVELLRARTRTSQYVFTGKRGGRADANFVSRKFRVAVRAANVDKRIHFHSLRHTFASLLVRNNTSLYQVQKLLGHSSPRVTEIYAHLQHTDMESTVNSLCLR
jgi:integrase